MDSTDRLRRSPVPGRVLTMGHFYIITLMDLVKAATWALPRVHAWSTGHVFSCMSGSRHNAAQRWGGFPGFCWQSSGLLSLFWLLSNDIQCMHWIISCYLHLSCYVPVNVKTKHSDGPPGWERKVKWQCFALKNPGICSHAYLMQVYAGSFI